MFPVDLLWDSRKLPLNLLGLEITRTSWIGAGWRMERSWEDLFLEDLSGRDMQTSVG